VNNRRINIQGYIDIPFLSQLQFIFLKIYLTTSDLWFSRKIEEQLSWFTSETQKHM